MYPVSFKRWSINWKCMIAYVFFVFNVNIWAMVPPSVLLVTWASPDFSLSVKHLVYGMSQSWNSVFLRTLLEYNKSWMLVLYTSTWNSPWIFEWGCIHRVVTAFIFSSSFLLFLFLNSEGALKFLPRTFS